MGWLLTKNRQRLLAVDDISPTLQEKATLMTNQLLTLEWDDTWSQNNGMNGTQADIVGALSGRVP